MSSEPQASKANGAEPVPETPKAKNLLQKLSEVVTAIDHVEKAGRNDFQKYNYVKAADIARAVRAELSARNIYLVSDVTEIRNYEIPAREGVMQAVDVKMEFSFFDGENLNVAPVVLHAWGTGTDKGDKAVYKAMTGALKYGLRNAFLIPDESDPEGDTRTDKATAAQEVGKAKVAAHRAKAAQNAPESQEQPEGKPIVLFSVALERDLFEISGDSYIMQANSDILLKHGLKHVDKKVGRATIRTNAEGLDAFKFAFEERGGMLKALKPAEA